MISPIVKLLKDIPLKIQITVSLFWQKGTIGPHTSLGKSRTHLGNTDMLCRAFHTCLGNLGALICSAAPITNSLVVLFNHALWALHSPYFTSPQHCSPVAQSMHSTVLPTPCLSLFFSVSYSSAKEWQKLGTCQLLPSRSSSSKDLLTMMKV